jgi:hypothetical protein
MIVVHKREDKEHRVFQALIEMIPGLRSRLLASSEEEIRLVADLVRPRAIHCRRPKLLFRSCRSKREFLVQDPMTPRA